MIFYIFNYHFKIYGIIYIYIYISYNIYIYEFLCNHLLLHLKKKTIFRYPSDIYDRVWLPYFQREWTQISTPLQVNNSNSYVPPKNALSTAARPTNSSVPLTIQWNTSYVNNQYYIYRHFAEIQELQTNDSREFNMTWNGEVIFNSTHLFL